MTLATVTVIFSSSFLSWPHISPTELRCLSTISNSYISFAVVIHFPPTLSRSLLMQSFHRSLGLPPSFFPTTFWASGVFAKYSFPIVSTCPALFNLLLASLFLNTFHSSLIRSNHSHDYSSPVVYAHCFEVHTLLT